MLTSRLEYLDRHRSSSAVLAGYSGKESKNPIHLHERQRGVHSYVCGVSGSGKSRFLQHLMFQDILRGHPLCVIDPMGDLYRSVHEFIATCLERTGDHGFPVRDLAERYVFLDAADPDNPVRINPLAPQDDESSEQQVDDLMRAVERLLGGMEQQRKLRNILRGAFMMTAELNRLSPERRPPVSLTQAEHYPLNLFFAAEILNMTDAERRALMAVLPESVRLRFRRQYWEFFALSGQAAKQQIVQSSWNVFQYLLDDSLVLRMIDTRTSTVHIPELLRRGQSLICHLPLGGNLRGAPFLGKMILTKFQQAAYRRPEAEWQRRYYLYVDEFHHFVDQALADALTNLRKFGISLINAHQSQSQPPFDTQEGQALLRTIKGNSRVKVVFRLDRTDAEIMSRELFELTQRRENFTAVDRAITSSEQRTTGTTHSSGRTDGSGESWSRSRTMGTGEQESFTPGGVMRTGTNANTGYRDDSGRSHHAEYSSGQQRSESTTTGHSETRTSRKIHYSLEGERELMINRLQKLADRECYLFAGALQGQLIITPFVPDVLYSYRAENFPATLLEWQRRRLQRIQDEVKEKKETVSTRVLPFAPAPLVPSQLPEQESEDEEEVVAAQAQHRQGNYPFVD